MDKTIISLALFWILAVAINPLQLHAVGVIPAPAKFEVTAQAGQQRLGPIFGGVTMSPSRSYFVAASRLPAANLPATIRAWRNNDTVLWSYLLPNNDDTFLVPVLGVNSTRLFVGTEAGLVYSLDATTADPVSPANRVKWSLNLTETVRAQLALSPDESTLYVRTTSGKLYAVRTSDSLQPGQNRLLWTTFATIGDTLPPVHGAHVNPFSPGPVVINDGSGFGKVFVATADGRILGFTTVGTTDSSRSASQVFTLDLKLSNLVKGLYESSGYFGTPPVAIEATPALGTNGWIYVATRNFAPAGGSLQILAAINPSKPTSTAVEWIQPV